MKISVFKQRYIDAMYLPERRQIAELFNLADELEAAEKTEENYRILSDIFSYLAIIQKPINIYQKLLIPVTQRMQKSYITLKTG